MVKGENVPNYWLMGTDYCATAATLDINIIREKGPFNWSIMMLDCNCNVIIMEARTCLLISLYFRQRIHIPKVPLLFILMILLVTQYIRKYAADAGAGQFRQNKTCQISTILD